MARRIELLEHDPQWCDRYQLDAKAARRLAAAAVPDLCRSPEYSATGDCDG